MKIQIPVVPGVLLAAAVVAVLAISHLQSPLPVQAAGPQSGFAITGAPSDRSPEVYQGSFTDSTLPEMLKHLGVLVDPSDKVYAFPDPALHVGSWISVYRSSKGNLIDGNTTVAVQTWAKTVGDVLNERNVLLGEQDTVVPSVDSPIPTSGTFTIQITRVAVTNLIITTPIPYTTVTTQDSTLEYGTTQVKTQGVNGVLSTTYQVRRENGVETSRVKLSSAVTQAPVTKKIAQGTKKLVLDSGIASYCVVSSGGGCHTSMTAAHKTLPMGMKVTVYNPANGKSVNVTISDRGPYVPGRVIDLAQDAAQQIGVNLGNVIIYKYYPPAN